MHRFTRAELQHSDHSVKIYDTEYVTVQQHPLQCRPIHGVKLQPLTGANMG